MFAQQFHNIHMTIENGSGDGGHTVVSLLRWIRLVLEQQLRTKLAFCVWLLGRSNVLYPTHTCTTAVRPVCAATNKAVAPSCCVVSSLACRKYNDHEYQY